MNRTLAVAILILCNQRVLLIVAASSSDAATIDPSLFRAEASVRADAAILDQETGRVFWEGSSSLHASIVPKLRVIPHFRATVFSLILWMAGWRYLMDEIPWRTLWSKISTARSILRREHSDNALVFAANTGGGRLSMMMLPRTILSFCYQLLRKFRIPDIPRPLLLATFVCYLLESLTSSTHRYLWNTVPSIEDSVNEIRHLPPVIEWHVRTFHYTNGIKRITARSTEAFQYKSCKDCSFAGVWKQRSLSDPPNFIKATLTKINVLSPKARRSYFQQQARFLKTASTDVFSEFSTNVHIGKQQRLFQSEHGIWWRSLYWICTLSGLTLPFRWYLTSHSNHVKVIIVKELYDTNVNEAHDEFVLPAMEEAVSEQ